jgi:Uma2 family endonuclease
MNAGLLNPPAPAKGSRRVHRFTVEDFYRLSESGALGPDHKRLELIEGEIYEPMSIGPSHSAAVIRLNRLVQRLLPDDFLVVCQGPVRLGPFNEPQPDLAVVKARADFYATAHPTSQDIVLLVEVADTTLDFDLGHKLAVYAAAGIVEYWVFDLGSNELHVFRSPRDGRFTETAVRRRTDTVECAAVADLKVEVQAVLG